MITEISHASAMTATGCWACAHFPQGQCEKMCHSFSDIGMQGSESVVDSKSTDP